MSGRTELERFLDGYLAEGPETVGDQALLRALAAVDRTKQRRDLLAPWRLSLMSINSRLAAVMLVAAIAVGGGAYFLGQRSAVGNTSPTPTVAPASVSPTPSPAAAAATPRASQIVSTFAWTPFTSSFYGFTVSHPATWSEYPGAGHWNAAAADEAAADVFYSPTGWPDFMGFESKIPAGMTAEAFLKSYTLGVVTNACYPLPSGYVPTTIDGHAANIAYAGCNEHFYFAEATVVIGDRIWIFDLHGPDRSLIVPFLSTVKIDPTKVVD